MKTLWLIVLACLCACDSPLQGSVGSVDQPVEDPFCGICVLAVAGDPIDSSHYELYDCPGTVIGDDCLFGKLLECLPPDHEC